LKDFSALSDSGQTEYGAAILLTQQKNLHEIGGYLASSSSFCVLLPFTVSFSVCRRSPADNSSLRTTE